MERLGGTAPGEITSDQPTRPTMSIRGMAVRQGQEDPGTDQSDRPVISIRGASNAQNAASPLRPNLPSRPSDGNSGRAGPREHPDRARARLALASGSAQANHGNAQYDQGRQSFNTSGGGNNVSGQAQWNRHPSHHANIPPRSQNAPIAPPQGPVHAAAMPAGSTRSWAPPQAPRLSESGRVSDADGQTHKEPARAFNGLNGARAHQPNLSAANHGASASIAPQASAGIPTQVPSATSAATSATQPPRDDGRAASLTSSSVDRSDGPPTRQAVATSVQQETNPRKRHWGWWNPSSLFVPEDLEPAYAIVMVNQSIPRDHMKMFARLWSRGQSGPCEQTR